MTNVKLKLMFFLLSALLTADVVNARPYSNSNTTDVVIKFNRNDTFHLPVDSNSDTLIAAEDQETSEETNRNSNTHMEDIVNAEQDRDEDMSEKYMKEHVMENPPEDGIETENSHMEAIMHAEQNRDKAISKKFTVEKVLELSKSEKQINISGSLLEKIMDAETDREGTLTDISEFAPRFEFLIAGKMNESGVFDRSGVSDSDNNLERTDRNISDVLRKVEYVELVEVGRKIGENKSAYYANITGHEVEDDLAPDTILSVFSGFTDMQTLVMACFATLLPLLAVLCATLLVRSMCRRWCRKPIASCSSSVSEKPDPVQLKSPAKEGSTPVEAPETSEPPANGSIFTMTLKNNHLIVETEERPDIAKNGRETKMKYSADNEGIFVVEVQQAAAYRPSNKTPTSPQEPPIATNQALVHRSQDEDKKPLEDSGSKALALSSTGLSISDLSMSSIGSHNGSYSYGGQVGYEQGPFGYPLYAGYDTSYDYSKERNHVSQEPLISKTPTDPDKPVVTAAVFKQDSIIGNDALTGPGYCIEGSTDGPLLSDVQAREVSLQHIHEQMEKKLENGVAVPMAEKIESPKKTFNRADSLPVRLEDEVHESVIEKNNVMETITEDGKDEVPTKEMLKGKRASLPIITTELYETVKDSIKAVGSPKFEKLTNDVSPAECTFDAPMITITEESEGKAESSS